MTREEMEKENEKAYRSIVNNPKADMDTVAAIHMLAHDEEEKMRDIARVLTWTLASIYALKADVEHMRQLLTKAAVEKGDAG